MEINRVSSLSSCKIIIICNAWTRKWCEYRLNNNKNRKEKIMNGKYFVHSIDLIIWKEIKMLIISNKIIRFQHLFIWNWFFQFFQTLSIFYLNEMITFHIIFHTLEYRCKWIQIFYFDYPYRFSIFNSTTSLHDSICISNVLWLIHWIYVNSKLVRNFYSHLFEVNP